MNNKLKYALSGAAIALFGSGVALGLCVNTVGLPAIWAMLGIQAVGMAPIIGGCCVVVAIGCGIGALIGHKKDQKENLDQNEKDGTNKGLNLDQVNQENQENGGTNKGLKLDQNEKDGTNHSVKLKKFDLEGNEKLELEEVMRENQRLKQMNNKLYGQLEEVKSGMLNMSNNHQQQIQEMKLDLQNIYNENEKEHKEHKEHKEMKDLQISIYEMLKNKSAHDMQEELQNKMVITCEQFSQTEGDGYDPLGMVKPYGESK